MDRQEFEEWRQKLKWEAEVRKDPPLGKGRRRRR